MKYKPLSFACLLFIGLLMSSNAFARVILNDIEYDIASWPVYVGDWCEFYTLAAANPKVENLVVVGRVDGVEVYRETFPNVSMEINPRVSFKWQPLTPGSHQIEIVADPDGLFGAPYSRILTMPVKPADLTYNPMRLTGGTLVEGQPVTITGDVVNKNDVAIRETFYVEFTYKTKTLAKMEIRGLAPREKKELRLDTICGGDYFDVNMKIDSTNAVTEANETNNITRLFLRCAKPGHALIPVK